MAGVYGTESNTDKGTKLLKNKKVRWKYVSSHP